MRTYPISILSCSALVLVTVLVAVANDAPSTSPKKVFRFLIQADESQEHLLAIPVSEKEEPPGNGFIVTCAGLRFERNAIVFVNVTMESKDNQITASDMTAQLDSVTGPNMPWDASDDFKMSFKTADAKQRFLQTHTR